MLVSKNTEKGGGGGRWVEGVFLAPCTDLEMWKKGYFFHFNSAIWHKRVFLGGPNLIYIVRQICTMTFTATGIYVKRCFTFSGYIMF